MELNYQQATWLHFEALREAGTRGSFPGGSALSQQEELFNSGRGTTLAVYEEHGLVGMLSLFDQLPGQCSAIPYLRYRHYSEYMVALLMNSLRQVASDGQKELVLESCPEEVLYGRVISHIWPEGKVIQVDKERFQYHAGSSAIDPNDSKLVAWLEETKSTRARLHPTTPETA